ncbi:MAG: type I-B CRISPR-associated protein Cas8b1/Cst1 [Acidobacterium ailaaui]|nr:type I-B CRISPR-associated protein Cas8b1/Cst1 [Pseudacidobacterium ailaaui]
MTDTTLVDTKTNTQNNTITLYPSNWLYNAGVIGLMRILNEPGDPVEKFIRTDGSISLSFTKNTNQIFCKWEELSPKSKKGTSIAYGWKDAYYANQTEDSIKKRIDFLCKININGKKGKVKFSCSFCTDKVQIKKSDATFLNQAFGNILLGSEKSFCNMYWNNSARDYVCPKCEFILMCHHLALTRLSDGSEIFINAPSFQVMWHLNQFAQKMYGSASGEESRDKREILAMSVIEYATKIQTTLGKWIGMNIEIINKYKVKKDNNWVNVIEHFNLPYSNILILSDRQIATLLSDIGEFRILNIVLNQEYGKLLDIGYRLLRIGNKDNEFKNDYFYLDKNKKNPNETAYKIFQLHALIEEKIKKI